MPPASGNIASTLEQQAETLKDRTAVIVARGTRTDRIGFQALHRESVRLASGFSRLGIKRGTRVLVMVPPGIEFIAITFALFKTGAVPILIDPGLGKQNLLQGIKEAEPEAMVAIPKAHWGRLLYPGPFAKTRILVTVGRRWFWGGKTLDQVRELGANEFETVPTQPGDPAAILFTSGSTGPAKGVLYTHGMFLHQLATIRDFYGIRPGEVELPTFPLFALFGTGMGMTCVIPEMDPTRPAQADPRKIIRAVEEFQVTSSFGSPALWKTVTRYCLDHNVRLPTIKRILMAGAPIPGSLLERFRHILDDDALIFTPYGATESLPVTSIGWKEILNETWDQTGQGKGTCVGRAVPGVTLKIIKISDAPIEEWDPALELPPGEIGEIVVQGAWVAQEYFRRPEATRLAKIRQGNTFWHRMGDAGYLDNQDRLWFCGRKSQRVVTANGTLFTIPCEGIFNLHADVERSALVGVGSENDCAQGIARRPVMVIEPKSPKRIATATARESFKGELLELAANNSLTREITEVLFYPNFPVDVRHNAKIFRERLAKWAEENF